MKIFYALFFCCLSGLCNRNRGFCNAQMNFTRTEGEDFRQTFTINVTESNSRKYLCRNVCRDGDIIIETVGNRVQKGRFIIRYDDKLHVSILELTRADAGRYRIGVGSSSSPGSFEDFNIEVRGLCESVVFGQPRYYSATDGENITVRCTLNAAERNKKFLCRDKCKKVLIETSTVNANSDKFSITYGSDRFFNVTIAQLTRSDSGRYRCGVGRSVTRSLNTCQEFEITVTNGYTAPLVVCLIMIVLVVVSLLLIYKWRTGHLSCLTIRGQSSNTNMEFGVSDGSAADDHQYATLDPPTYETLNQYNMAPDQTYDTLG